ncbi:GTP pyrophosphokinase [Rhodovibrio salinarum]|uniref:GTP pyrophosphokinase n=1 Tax=Rhodovibrio salinarum TaxID=1087 RepID=UPI001470B4A6|nr:GTP pyrophosphokinase [Rhodovibrio salinarum]
MKDSEWLTNLLAKHNNLTGEAKSIIRNALDQKGVEYIEVDGRTKTLNSATEKIKRKGYSSPEKQLTDLTGIRIVTFFEFQIDQISQTIKEYFEVDEYNSLDRTDMLGDDRVGYRSVHFVCTLGEGRDHLPEYRGLCGLKFEVQVRTVLQHAWAELQHDRAYKFSGELPGHLKRELNLYAGMLEIVDGAFSKIALEVDQYKNNIDLREDSNLQTEDINSISVERYISDKISKLVSIDYDEIGPQPIKELKYFGCHKISDLDHIFNEEFFRIIAKHVKEDNFTGILRTAMMLYDIDRYFQIFGGSWHGADLETYAALKDKWGEEKMKKYFDESSVDSFDYIGADESDEITEIIDLHKSVIDKAKSQV